MQPRHLAHLFALLALPACATIPASPPLTLQRSIHPAVGSLGPDEIESAFAIRVAATAPASAGLAWLSETGAVDALHASPRLSEYARAGVLDAALSSLRTGPLVSVASLPTIDAGPSGGPDSSEVYQQLRSACARFQYDVALVLQTAFNQKRTFNPLALGYLGLVTRPLFPGDDIGVSATAELCALDVKSGVMLGCAQGRETGVDRYVFPRTADAHSERLIEQMVAAAVVDASAELIPQLAQRLAPLEVSAPTPSSR